MNKKLHRIKRYKLQLAIQLITLALCIISPILYHVLGSRVVYITDLFIWGTVALAVTSFLSAVLGVFIPNKEKDMEAKKVRNNCTVAIVVLLCIAVLLFLIGAIEGSYTSGLMLIVIAAIPIPLIIWLVGLGFAIHQIKRFGRKRGVNRKISKKPDYPVSTEEDF